MTRRLLALAGCLALVTSTPAFAQLAPPNDLGVALGHIHLVVKNVDAQKEFWTTMLGGTMVSNGPLTLIQFPGIFIMLRQGEATGPPAGSIVNHFGLVYKDLAAARARWKAAGVKFVVADKAAFYKATQPIRDKYGAKYAALIKQIEDTK